MPKNHEMRRLHVSYSETINSWMSGNDFTARCTISLPSTVPRSVSDSASSPFPRPLQCCKNESESLILVSDLHLIHRLSKRQLTQSELITLRRAAIQDHLMIISSENNNNRSVPFLSASRLNS